MPSIKSTLLAAALASAAAAKSGKVNVYYGQHGSRELADICQTGIDYVTLSFINETPENTGKGIPASNFGNHCLASTSVLQDDCPAITNDNSFQVCHDNGVKILLSIGGVYNAASSDYSLSSTASATSFANFLWGAFGPYDPTFTGPRPFDVDGVHNVVDGFDLDIEENFPNQGPWNTFVDTMRANFDGGDYLLTAAPQCPFSDPNFQMGGILSVSKFDAIWIQFYNNEVCDALHDGFNLDDFATYLATNGPNGATPLYIGLPAAPGAAGSGYLDADKFEALIAKYKDDPNYSGIMLWDDDFAISNVVDSSFGEISYLDLAIKLAADATSSSSSSSASASSTSSSASASSTSSSVSASATSESSASSSASSTSSSISASATSESSASSASSVSSTFSASSSSFSSFPLTNTSTTASAPPTSSDAGLTTSTVRATVTSTILSCAPTVTNCPYGHVTTVVVDLYTTVCPVSATASATVHPSIPNNAAAPSKTPYNNGTTSLVTVVTSQPSATVSRLPSSPSSVFTAGAAKVSSQMCLAVLAVAALMMML